MSRTILPPQGFTSGVYALRNRVTGAMYVGSTSNMAVRWRGHENALHRGKHRCPPLQAAWDHDGREAFDIVALERLPETTPRAERIAIEERWQQDLVAAGATLYNSLSRLLADVVPPPPVIEWHPSLIRTEVTA